MATPCVCPISEYPHAEELTSSGDYRLISSRPFRSVYRLTAAANKLLEGLSGREAARLATWVVDQKNLGVQEPMVSSEVIDMAVNSRPLSVIERVDRFYRYLGRNLSGLGETIPWSISNLNVEFGREALVNRTEARLWSECASPEELESICNYVSAQGRVHFTRSGSRLGLSVEGWQYIESLASVRTQTDQGFVAMWFGPEVSDAYNNGIAPAIMEAGYVPMRIDQKEHANRIDDEIIAEIRRSRFVVADFTCGLAKDSEGKVVFDKKGDPTPLPRGGVYYEAGFAQGLGIPVIWMCRQDHINHVHFDTRQFNHITWTDAKDLREKLKNRIGAVLGDGPNVHH